MGAYRGLTIRIIRVRKVSPDGIITTVAGTDQGPPTGYSGEGGPAIAASLSWPDGLAVDNKGNLYIADGNRLLKVDAQGIISTVAGNGTGPVRDGIAATSVFLIPNHPAVDSQGSLYFKNNSQVLRVGAQRRHHAAIAVLLHVRQQAADEFGDEVIEVTRLNFDGETLTFSVPSKGSPLFAVSLKNKREGKLLDGGGKFDGAVAKLVFNKDD